MTLVPRLYLYKIANAIEPHFRTQQQVSAKIIIIVLGKIVKDKMCNCSSVVLNTKYENFGQISLIPGLMHNGKNPKRHFKSLSVGFCHACDRDT